MSDDDDLFSTPTYKLYRRSDPDTSRSAAESIDVSNLERKVLQVIAHGDGLISDEVRGHFPATTSYSSVTARYKSLKEKGLIDMIGTRPGASGRQQSVMVATDLGKFLASDIKPKSTHPG